MAHATPSRRTRQARPLQQQLAQAPGLPFADLLSAEQVRQALRDEQKKKKGSGVFFLDAFWSRRYLVRMPRRLRCATGGFVYHALNRAVGRATLFDQPGDYAAFLKVLREANDWLPMRLLAWCALPNHWHLVLWPQRDRDLSEYLRWLTVTHTQRWHAHHHTAGTGPLYQGRFKSFPTRRTTTCSASGAMSSAIRCALSWCPAPRIGAGRAWRSACRAAGPRC